MSYWDTSALVKLYLREPGSTQYEAIAARAERVVTCAFARHEARTVFRRRESERAIANGEAETLYQLLAADLAAGEVVAIPETAAVEAAFALALETWPLASAAHLHPHPGRLASGLGPHRR